MKLLTCGKPCKPDPCQCVSNGPYSDPFLLDRFFCDKSNVKITEIEQLPLPLLEKGKEEKK